MEKKTKAKMALAIAGTVLTPVIAVWVAFTGRDLMLPGSTLTGLVLSVLIGAGAAGVFIKSIGYFFKEEHEN